MIINRKISHMYAPVRRALGVSPKRGSYRRNNASGTTRVSALRNEIEPNVGEEVNSTRGANLRRRGTLRKMDTGRPFKKVKLEGEFPALPHELVFFF